MCFEFVDLRPARQALQHDVLLWQQTIIHQLGSVMPPSSPWPWLLSIMAHRIVLPLHMLAGTINEPCYSTEIRLKAGHLTVLYSTACPLAALICGAAIVLCHSCTGSGQESNNQWCFAETNSRNCTLEHNHWEVHAMTYIGTCWSFGAVRMLYHSL